MKNLERYINMALGDIYSVSLRSSDGDGQEMRNVHFYRQSQLATGINPPTQDLELAFVQNFLLNPGTITGYPGLVSATCDFVGTDIYNLFNPLELRNTTFLTPIPGERGSDPAPSYVAWGFQTARVRRDIRRGHKRVSVPGETDLVGNLPIAGFSTALNAFSSFLGATILDTGNPSTSGVFVPVIVKRIKMTDPDGAITYRLPVSALEAEFFDAVNWAFTKVTSQVSRRA